MRRFLCFHLDVPFCLFFFFSNLYHPAALPSIIFRIIAFARYYYAMAVEGHFFQSFAKVSKKTQVPVVSLFWQAVIACALVLLRNLDQLTSLVVFCGMVFNVLVVIAVIIYRKKFPDLERPYKAWGYPVTVVVSVVLFAALGAAVYFLFDAKLKKERGQA